MGSTPSGLSGGFQELSQTPQVINIQDVQSLRVQRPSLLWVWMNGCHWSQVSAPVMSRFAKMQNLPVQGIDGIAQRKSLASSGFVPKGFPTIQLLKAGPKNVAVEFNDRVSEDNLMKFVNQELR